MLLFEKHFFSRLIDNLQDSFAISKSKSLQVSLCSNSNISDSDDDEIRPTFKGKGSQKILSSEENSPALVIGNNTLSDILGEDRNSQGNILFLDDSGIF